MQTIKAIVIGLVAAFAVGFGLSFLLTAAGAKEVGFAAWAPAVFAGVFAAYIAGNLAGNRRVAEASDEDRTEALTSAPPPGQARLYVYRDGFVGSAAGLNVSVDGADVGQLKSPRFLSVALPAGRHTVRAGFGGLAGPQNNPSEETFDLAPGQTLALKAVVRMGALKNTVAFEPQTLTPELKMKLSRMKMVEAAATA